MGVIKKIIIDFNNFLLSRTLRRLKLEVVPCGFKQAKSIGFLINTQYFNVSALQKQITQLIDQNKKISVLAYTENHNASQPKLNTSSYLLPISKKHFSRWIIKPKTSEVTDFINTHFDLLICFDESNDYILSYISHLSKSKFKTGIKGNYQNSACHFLLDLKENEKSIDNIFDQLNNYLSILEHGH